MHLDQTAFDDRTYLITNSDRNHKDELLSHFKTADEIWFAVAFLKEAGMSAIKNELSAFLISPAKKANFYVGLGLGETDPKSLSTLNNLLKKSGGTLVLCNPGKGIFHSKAYMFRTGNRASIIIGSANMTLAGWSVNDELSICVNVPITDSRYIALKKYFKELQQQYYTHDLDRIIEDYAEQREAYNDQKRPPFRFKKRGTVTHGLDISQIEAYYREYQNSEYSIDVKAREEQYSAALKNLKILASAKALNRQEFHDLFGPLMGHAGYQRLWHSGSIQRRSHETLEYRQGFRELVRLAFSIQELDIETAYNRIIARVKSMKRENTIKGVGENILAEILMTIDPTKFANLNKNPITVLNYFGKDFPDATAFKGSDYAKYLKLLEWLIKKLKMKTYLEIDSFFNYLYWPIYQGLL